MWNGVLKWLMVTGGWLGRNWRTLSVFLFSLFLFHKGEMGRRRSGGPCFGTEMFV